MNFSIQIDGSKLSIPDIQLLEKNALLPIWEKEIYKFILNWFDDSDYILQKTSGSTGTPKKIKLQKTAMIASAKKTIHFFDLKAYDTAWLCLPIEYIAGKMMVVRAIVGDLNLIISAPKGTPKIPEVNVDFTAMVPLQLQKLLENKKDFSTLKTIIVGGAAVDYPLQNVIQKIPSTVYSTYGMTETCSHIALQRLNGSNPDQHYHLLPGISISVNKNNCLQINAPELSNEVLETNDMVELISSNEFKLLGRADHVINSGGIKISPEILEAEIAAILKRECLILPLPDKILGEKLVLVLTNLEDKSHSEKLLSKIKEQLGKHRTPKTVYFLDEFPRNKSMKIDRKKVFENLIIHP